MDAFITSSVSMGTRQERCPIRKFHKLEACFIGVHSQERRGGCRRPLNLVVELLASLSSCGGLAEGLMDVT
jgi:hypothetical protein